MNYYAAASIIFLSAAAMADSNIDQINTGDKINGILTIGANKIPIPAGDWEVANLHTGSLNVCHGHCDIDRTQEIDKIKTIVLIKTKNNNLQAMLHISSPLNNSGNFDKVGVNDCDKKSGYYYESKGSVYFPECLRVYHAANFLQSDQKSAFWEEIRLYIGKNNKIPSTVISSKYVYSSQYGHISYTYSVNPEQFGFEPAKSSNWDTNEWHPKKESTQQKEFTDRMVEWAKKMTNITRKSIKDKETTSLPDFANN